MDREQRRRYQAQYRKKKGGQKSYASTWARKNPSKVKAHSAEASKVKSGAKKKPSKCANCGSTKDVQRHHLSYNPSKTKDLCAKCHGATKRG